MRSLPALVAAGIGAAVIVAAIAGVILVADDGDATPPAPTAVATDVPSRLGVAVDLRSGPSNRVAIAARLEPGTLVTVEGRNDSGDWLRVRIIGEDDLVGWVPRNAVLGSPRLDDLEVVTTAPAPTPAPTTTVPPDLPDLVVRGAESRQNRLVVTLANEGTVDVTGTILLALGDAEPEPIDVKAGEPLLPGDELELRYDDEYVQRRGRIVIVASVEPPIEELNTANNRLNVVIEPDLDNDLGVVNALLVAGRGLVVEVRNNSPIPIVGLIEVDVREQPEDTLLGRQRVEVELLPEESIELEFGGIVELDFTRAMVLLSSDALDDALVANNTFPR